MLICISKGGFNNKKAKKTLQDLAEATANTVQVIGNEALFSRKEKLGNSPGISIAMDEKTIASAWYPGADTGNKTALEVRNILM